MRTPFQFNSQLIASTYFFLFTFYIETSRKWSSFCGTFVALHFWWRNCWFYIFYFFVVPLKWSSRINWSRYNLNRSMRAFKGITSEFFGRKYWKIYPAFVQSNSQPERISCVFTSWINSLAVIRCGVRSPYGRATMSSVCVIRMRISRFICSHLDGLTHILYIMREHKLAWKLLNDVGVLASSTWWHLCACIHIIHYMQIIPCTHIGAQERFIC